MDSLIENITGYVEARIELLKLEIKEEVAKGIAKALVYVVIIAVFTLFVLLISIAAAYRLGELFGIFEGFTIVAGFYFLLVLLLVQFRNSIIEKLEKKLEEKMMKKKK